MYNKPETAMFRQYVESFVMIVLVGGIFGSIAYNLITDILKFIK
jgi:hypothetical protein